MVCGVSVARPGESQSLSLGPLFSALIPTNGRVLNRKKGNTCSMAHYNSVPTQTSAQRLGQLRGGEHIVFCLLLINQERNELDAELEEKNKQEQPIGTGSRQLTKPAGKRVLPRRASEYNARVVIAERRIRSTSIGEMGRRVNSNGQRPFFSVKSREQGKSFTEEQKEIKTGNLPSGTLEPKPTNNQTSEAEVVSWFPLQEQEDEAPAECSNHFVILEELYKTPTLDSSTHDPPPQSRSPPLPLPLAKSQPPERPTTLQPPAGQIVNPKKTLTEEEYWRGFFPYLPQIMESTLNTLVDDLNLLFHDEGGSDVSVRDPTSPLSFHSHYTKRLVEFVVFIKVHDLVSVITLPPPPADLLG